MKLRTAYLTDNVLFFGGIAITVSCAIVFSVTACIVLLSKGQTRVAVQDASTQACFFVSL